MLHRSLVVAAFVILLPTYGFAAPIIFDLRDHFVETLDDVNPFPLAVDGLTATLTALPSTFNEPPVRNLVLNQTSASFGINVDNTICDGDEEASQISRGYSG